MDLPAVLWANRASGDNDVEISAGPGAAGLAGGRGSQVGAEHRAGHPDPCALIGRAADGKLVYSMTCENLPTPSPPPPAAEPEPETRRSGIFGWFYGRR